MNPSDPNLAKVELIAAALGALCDELVFVGGCAAGLLMSDPAATPARVTFDVDLVAEVAAFAPVEGQVGALFAVNGSPWGIDLFDSPATLGKTLPKLVRSYALDAIDVATDKAMPVLEQEALRFVSDTLAARVDRFPAVGLGEDLRLASPTLTGGALAVDGKVVHLCAFRLSREVHGDTPAQGHRLARASVRRRASSRS